MKSMLSPLLFIVNIAIVVGCAYLESSKFLVSSQHCHTMQNLNEIDHAPLVRNQQRIVQNVTDSLWGIDYLTRYAKITNFKVQKALPTNTGNAYAIENNPMVQGTVKGNVNLFKHILPEVKALDVTAHNALQFNVINNQEIEIILVPQASIAWHNRYKFTIPANPDMTCYDIPFKDFVNTSGASFTHGDIKTIVFSVLSDYKNIIPFSIALSDLRFGNYEPKLAMTYGQAGHLIISNAPNPFNYFTTFSLPISSNIATITVYNMSGLLVDTKVIKTINDGLQFEYNAPDLKNGIYHYSVITDSGKKFTGKFIIN